MKLFVDLKKLLILLGVFFFLLYLSERNIVLLCPAGQCTLVHVYTQAMFYVFHHKFGESCFSLLFHHTDKSNQEAMLAATYNIHVCAGPKHYAIKGGVKSSEIEGQPGILWHFLLCSLFAML